ncbi:MAG: 2-C-methyl-D-erythritol 4-phosphate cytidylyltransferase [Actinomycetota bacterium]|nr:2-C-methyl-D-erythritol 4-phosphate cytidylyltransferase [Actinomycetota bacterium]
MPKQFRALAGKSVLARSLDAVLSSGCRPCVIAVPQDRLDHARAEVEGISEVVVVSGGHTRQGSVRAALELVAAETVVVHDAARPLAPAALFVAVVEALREADGAVPGAAVDETLKRAHAGLIVETVERACLFRIQTPQAFRTAALKEAHFRAHRDGFEGTDDAQLLERLGYRIALVEGAGPNPKLTHPADFELAEVLLRG